MRIRAFGLLATAVALLASLTAVLGQELTKEGKATVRVVHGTVQWRSSDQPWDKLRVNQQLAAGVTIQTGPDSYTDISANGISSVIRINADSRLDLEKMTYGGSLLSGDQETLVDLKTGEIVGNVKKISDGSRFRIHTPDGTAFIQGADFRIEAQPAVGGAFKVIYTCVQGRMSCSTGQEAATLATGESWIPGEPAAVSTMSLSSNPPPSLRGKEIPAVRELAAAYNAFGIDLLRVGEKANSEQSVFLSPVSVAFGLSMLQNGA